MDYKAAYETERRKRIEAEIGLENQSRNLRRYHQQLESQLKSLKSETAQKSFLLNIAKYSQERLRLREILPELIGTMLQLADLPFALFDYLPIKRDDPSFRSQLYFNNEHSQVDCLSKLLNEDLIDNILVSTSVDVLQLKEAVWVENLAEICSGAANELFQHFSVKYLLAMPIVANQHVSAILFFFVDKLENEKQHIIDLFESALKNLGFLIEHRHQDEQLKNNYDRLSQMFRELNLAQQQLIQSEKLASIGQLSAGIAHEINNPVGFIKSNLGTLKQYLTVYRGYIELCRSVVACAAKRNTKNSLSTYIEKMAEYEQEQQLDYIVDDCRCLVEESEQGIERIIEIVSGLKKFSRTTDGTKQSCQINDCLEQALKLSHNELKYKAKIDSQFGELPPVMANSGELVQVFINLLVNAAQAIKKGQGTITVSTAIEGSQVVVTVSDTGCGIAQERLEHIFDPFYTTKQVGEGTGLGLSISYGIVENHSGQITVSSKVGEGTQFTIKLPAIVQYSEAG